LHPFKSSFEQKRKYYKERQTGSQCIQAGLWLLVVENFTAFPYYVPKYAIYYLSFARVGG
jgi:hypothetical protein